MEGRGSGGSRREKYRPSSALAHEVKMPKINFCDGSEDLERMQGYPNSQKRDARYVGHHKN